MEHFYWNRPESPDCFAAGMNGRNRICAAEAALCPAKHPGSRPPNTPSAKLRGWDGRLVLLLERDNDDLEKAYDRAHKSGPECVNFKTFDKMFVPFHRERVPREIGLRGSSAHFLFPLPSSLFHYPDNERRK